MRPGAGGVERVGFLAWSLREGLVLEESSEETVVVSLERKTENGVGGEEIIWSQITA